MRLRSALRCLAALTLAVIGTGRADAHAVLQSSVPQSGETVASGKLHLELRFNSRIDHARSRLTLVRPDHTEATVPPDTAAGPEWLAGNVDLPAGRYTVRWQVLAVDGHITRGSVGFTVRGR
jgi:methionine-rich copper-binding protein CopC